MSRRVVQWETSPVKICIACGVFCSFQICVLLSLRHACHRYQNRYHLHQGRHHGTHQGSQVRNIEESVMNGAESNRNHIFRVMYAISLTTNTLGLATSYIPEYMKAKLAGE